MLDRITIIAAGNVVAAASFLVVALVLAASTGRSSISKPRSLALLSSLVLTAAWAAARLLDQGGRSTPLPWSLVDLGRAAAWAGFAWLVARLHEPAERQLGNLLGVLATLTVGVGLTAVLAGRPALAEAGRLLLACLGLAASGMIARHALGAARRGLGALLVALVIVFGLDLVSALLAVLDPRNMPMVELMRPAGMILALPPLMLAAAQNPVWAFDLPVSRRLAHRLAFGAMIALVAVVLLDGARLLQSRIGPAAALTLAVALAAALAAAAAHLASARRRDTLLRAVRRYVFSDRYDYREEWLGFIDTLGDEGTDATPLPERVVDAVAQVMSAGGGALWLQDGDRVRLAAHRDLVLPVDPPLDPASISALLSLTKDGVVDLERHGASDRGAQVAQGWRAIPGAWLILPLVHRRRLVGLLVLARPRVRRALDWEDRMLLRTLARACGSYLVEDLASRALQEAREFDSFNRRFAFVAHDLKHVAARLGLVVTNARRFRGNPAFYDDLLETLEDTAARADRLVREMRGEPPTVGGTDVALLVEGVVAGRDGRRPMLETTVADLRIQADAARLASALDHLIDNGFDACVAGGDVKVTVREETRMAVIEVRDTGTGIAPDYLARSFGKPFVTTKSGGMGLGLYEVRHTVEAMGGRLEAESTPGAGTVMRLYLPRLAEQRP